MKKLLRTLQKLTPDQFRELINAISHPPYSLASETQKLFNYLVPAYPDFGNCSYQGFSNQYHSAKLEPTEFRLRCSYLLAAVYQFLANTELSKNALLWDKALITSLMKLEEYQEASRQLAFKQEKWANHSTLGSHFFFEEVHWKEIALELGIAQDMQSSNHAFEDYFLSLDKMYVGMQLKYLMSSLSANRIFGTEFPFERWEYCKQKMEDWGNDAPPLAQIYFHLTYLMLIGDHQHYHTLIQLIEHFSYKIAETERLNIYGFLQNYLSSKILKGEKNATQSLFQLFQRLEKERLIFGRGSYTEHLVRNIINVSCRLGDLAWAEKFLTQNQSKIVQSAGENVWYYISAFHQFYAKQYSKALKNLQEVKTTAPNYRTGHQTLLLRIYYELNDFESVEAVATTFRRYLNRNDQLSDRQKDLNRNFISIVQLLAKIKEQGMTIYRKRRIEEFLASDQGITDRTWLAEKFKELNK